MQAWTPTPTRLLVMRHGESVVNIEKRLSGRTLTGDLTALGREQAQRAGKVLMKAGITQIRISPFDRARQTAAIVSAAIGLEPVIDDDLREMDCGAFDGKTDAESWGAFMSIYRRWLAADASARYPDGESWQEGAARFRRGLAKAEPNTTTLFVTHGGISSAVIPYLCVNAAVLRGSSGVGNTGIVELEVYDTIDGQARYACLAWNRLDHLE